MPYVLFQQQLASTFHTAFQLPYLDFFIRKVADLCVNLILLFMMRNHGGATVLPTESPITGGIAELEKKRNGLGSWMLMDSSGQEATVNIDKYEVMERTQINARDLRIIDPVLGYPAAIFSREKAIVLNLEHITAIITAEEVFIRNQPDESIEPVIAQLRRRINSSSRESSPNRDFDKDDHPFEIRVLDIVLEAICSYLSARTTELENDVYPALDLLTSKISARNLEHVRKLKSQMTRLTTRVHKVQDELEKLLDDEDDMVNLYLSRKLARTPATMDNISDAAATGRRTPLTSSTGPEIREASSANTGKDHEKDNEVLELEMLLEAYYSNMEETFDKLSMLHEYIESTEDYLNIQLDNLRNQLIKVDLLLNSAHFALSIYNLMAAILGMVIPYQWNQGHSYLFTSMNVMGGLVAIATYSGIYYYARSKRIIVS